MERQREREGRKDSREGEREADGTRERDSTRVREIESDRGERERHNKERKRRTDLRRSAPNNDSRPRSVAREPRSREHLSVSLAPPREIPAFPRVYFDLPIANLNWHVIQGKEEKSEGESSGGKRIQSVQEGFTFDDRGLNSASELHRVEQKAEFAESSVIPCEQELRKDDGP